ncbi:MAG: putative histidine secretory acid phosphatase [Comamonadaceae bacterium]|nr:MAG: putative histidine secretory acid phosphatase [Comamonadaceae bacterium]
MTTYIAQTLIDQGYTGATGTTPYKPATAGQITQLQNIYNKSFAGQVTGTASTNAIHININFDGTQNNGKILLPGDVSETNVWKLSDLQRNAGDQRNTIYESGIGAQTVKSGTLDANGNPAPGSSPSDWESTPWKAGEVGNAILDSAYKRLTARVAAILADPNTANAEIALNLAGFSRGSAEAVAFANLLNQRGIPGLYEPGHVPVNSMVLYDPVNQTAGSLNTTWPTNVQNTLVLVALNEGRDIMSAMPVGANAIVIGVPGAHSDIGGSFNPQGVSAITLKITKDFLEATGSKVAAIPDNLQPDFSQMNIHNSGLDNYGNVKWTFTDGNRYYESGGLGSIAVQDMLGQGLKLDPVYVNVNGKLDLVAFRKTLTSDTTDPLSGQHTVSRDATVYATDGITVQGRAFDSTVTDTTGQVASSLKVTYAGDGSTILQTELTERQANNSLLTTVRDGQGSTLSTTHLQTYDDGSTSTTTAYPNGNSQTLTTNADGTLYQKSQTVVDANGNTDTSVTDAAGKSVRNIHTDYIQNETGTSRIETVTTSAGTVRNTYGTDGVLISSEALSPGADSSPNTWKPVPTDGSQPWYETPAAQQLGNTLTGMQSLIAALKSGKPLPIATATFNLAATVSRNAELAGISQGLGTLSSLDSFTQALQRGDELAAISSGASFVNNVYIELFKDTVTRGIAALGGINAARALADMGDEAAASLVQTADVFQNLSDALPYLNLINSVAHGDTAGSIVAIASIAGYPVVGWIYAGGSILLEAFKNEYSVNGIAVPISSQDGQHAHANIIVSNERGGETAGSVLDGLIGAVCALMVTKTAGASTV